MNKGKLRSLMFHAGFCNEDGGWDDRPIHEQEHDNFQKFAELIVRECLTLREDMSPLDAMKDEEIGGAAMVRVSDASFNIYYNKIKEHFGVE